MQQAVDKNTFSQRLGLYLVGSFAGSRWPWSLPDCTACCRNWSVTAGARSACAWRWALPARSVARLVLRQGSILVGSGLAAGLVLAFATGRLVKSFLYQVRPLDTWTYAAVALALALIGPGRRAAACAQSRIHSAHAGPPGGIGPQSIWS